MIRPERKRNRPVLFASSAILVAALAACGGAANDEAMEDEPQPVDPAEEQPVDPAQPPAGEEGVENDAILEEEGLENAAPEEEGLQDDALEEEDAMEDDSG